MDALLVAVLFGVALILAAPILHSWLPRQVTEGLSLAGLALEAFGFAASCIAFDGLDAALAVSGATLGWGLVVYLTLQIKLHGIKIPGPLIAEEHCVSKLTRGQHSRVPQSGLYAKLTSTFSELAWIFECTPTDSSLEEYFSAYGYDYYVVWFWFYDIPGYTRTINIQCEIDKNGRCAMANPIDAHGSTAPKDRSLAGCIAEQVTYEPDAVTIVVAMGVALDAATITVNLKAGKKGVGASANIKFPSASKNSGSVDMGTFKWVCAGDHAMAPPGAAPGTTPGHTAGPTEHEDDENDCGFSQSLALVVRDGPELGYIKYSYTISISGDEEAEDDDLDIVLDEDGHFNDSIDFDPIVVEGGCSTDFTYKAEFEFEVFDENDVSLGSGTAEVTTYVKDCKVDGDDNVTLDFDLQIASTKIDGFLRLTDFLCV